MCLWPHLHQIKHPTAHWGSRELSLHVQRSSCNAGWNPNSNAYVSLKHFPQILQCVAVVTTLSWRWNKYPRFTDEEAGPQRGVSVTCHGGEAKICISFYYSVSNRIRARIYCLLSTRLFVKHFISWITSVNSHIPFVTPIVWITFGRIQRTERLSNFPRATLLACNRVGTQTLVFLTRSVRECYSYITTILKK